MQLLIVATLGVLGAIGGLILARWTLGLISLLLPIQAADIIQVRLDPTVVGFAGALAIGTGLIFGLFPAIYSSRPDIISALKGQSGQSSGGHAAARFRSLLATMQIALAAMMLLVSAGLFSKSLFNISRVELGMMVDNVVGFSVTRR